MLKIYEEKPIMPSVCKENDPTLPFCQIKGEYLFKPDLPNRTYNSQELYSHMNDKCPSMSPEFAKTKGC